MTDVWESDRAGPLATKEEWAIARKTVAVSLLQEIPSELDAELHGILRQQLEKEGRREAGECQTNQ